MKEGPTLKEEMQLEKVKVFFRNLPPSVKSILILACGLFIGIIIPVCILGVFNTTKPSDNISSQDSSYDNSSTDTSTKDCNVAGINLHGTVVTYNSPEAYNDQDNLIYDQTSSDGILWYIGDANSNPDIKAIIIEVDSGGGSPIAGEEISNAIKNSEKPVVAYIRAVGASSAYLAISSADKIFASKYSDVGSIGITMSYVSNVENNIKEGYTYEELSSGKFKNSGDPDKVLTYEERNLLLRDVNIMFENFVKAVAENRRLTVSAVKAFADGSTVLGEKAKELGMIDEIGGFLEAEKYLETTIGEKPEICW